jgi:hypothetical protein
MAGPSCACLVIQYLYSSVIEVGICSSRTPIIIKLNARLVGITIPEPVLCPASPILLTKIQKSAAHGLAGSSCQCYHCA